LRVIGAAEFKKMRNSLKQRISKIDRSETGKENEESAMVGAIVSLVIDEFIQSGFRKKRTIDARYKMGGPNELASMAACCVSFQLSFSKDQIAVAVFAGKP
jgi:hypothetical protein